MRTIAVITVLAAAAAPARADGFLDLVGGLAVPLGDDTWKQAVDISPKLGARVGALAGDLGGLVAVDWTPEGVSSNFPFTRAAAHRFRVLVEVVGRHRLAPKVTLAGRAGAGIDIAHVSYSVPVLNVAGSDTSTGVAFELGGGLWFDVSSTTQLGFELALPIAHQPRQATGYAFDYTSYDLDVLFGVRLWSR